MRPRIRLALHPGSCDRVEPKAARIIIVDDADQDLRVHATTLRSKGYEVVTATSGKGALAIVETLVPDLFLIAAHMREMDGFALCERLKDDPRLINVPVIFVMPQPKPDEIDRGYEAGGVDYISKPCHLSEFLARVGAQIRMSRLLQEVARLQEVANDANPLTHLPGNNTIVSAIQRAIDAREDMTVIYADLDSFKAFNDHYGFSSGDDLLLFTAETLQTAIRVLCPEGSFLGHEGGDDFVLMVDAAHAEELGAEIIRRFTSGAAAFYSETDAKRGYIEALDRQGKPTRYPLASLSMAGVRLLSHVFSRFLEVASVCAEVKHAAKAIPGSVFFMDRRGRALPADDTNLEATLSVGGGSVAPGR
jgi:diguanylate cyclase (GGDEF)-like protein